MMCYPLISCREEGLGTFVPTSGQVATSCSAMKWLSALTYTCLCNPNTESLDYGIWLILSSLLYSSNSQGIIPPPTLSTPYKHLLELLAKHLQMVTGPLYVEISLEEGEQRQAPSLQGVVQQGLGTIILVYRRWTLLWCFGQSESLQEEGREGQKRTALVLNLIMVSILVCDKLWLLSWLLHSRKLNLTPRLIFPFCMRKSLEVRL